MNKTNKLTTNFARLLQSNRILIEKQESDEPISVVYRAINVGNISLGETTRIRIDDPITINQILNPTTNKDKPDTTFISYTTKPNVKVGEVITDLKQINKYGFVVEIDNFEHTRTGGLIIDLFATNFVKITDVNVQLKSDYNTPFIEFIEGDADSGITFFDDANDLDFIKNIADESNRIMTMISELNVESTSLLSLPEMPDLLVQLIDVNENTGFIYKNGIHLLMEQAFNNPNLTNTVKKIKEDYTKYGNTPINAIELLSIFHKLNVSSIEKNNLSDELEKQIDTKLKSDLDKQQKDFILREKMRIIKNLLDDNGGSTEKTKKENVELENKNNRYPDEVLTTIKEEKEKLRDMMPSSPNADITKTYIDQLTNLPWRKSTIFNTSIKKANKLLAENHYGLEEVKKRIIEYIAIAIKRNETKNSKTIKIDDNTEVNLDLFKAYNELNTQVDNYSPILTLVGPPGTGKTSLAKSIANALGRKFIKISLGGVHDEAEIRGHRRTYVGAMPGKIINAINKSGVSNPVILLDEIDKMSSDRRGDPTSALLEVLDPEQNSHFQDNYIELEYDLSEVMFVATANYYENIPPALLDRVEIIELNSYTISEKIKIAREYLIERVLKQNYASKDLFEISDEILQFIIKHYTMEAGVRGLYRELDKITRRIIVQNLNKTKKTVKTVVLNEKEIIKLLGVIKIDESKRERKSQVGAVNGLAYTSYGGSTLEIEVTTYPGKGDLKLTGQLKDVMQESAQIAATYVRANADKFKINFNFEENTIHIHVPEGATPKDGPSAGVTFTTAIISALSKKAVPANVGMTGEITLRGKVLEIGGLKEKSFAAYQKGITQVFIPKSNKKHLQDIPKEVTDAIEYIPVENYNEIYARLFK